MNISVDLQFKKIVLRTYFTLQIAKRSSLTIQVYYRLGYSFHNRWQFMDYRIFMFSCQSLFSAVFRIWTRGFVGTSD
jgi:hypothetical protein